MPADLVSVVTRTKDRPEFLREAVASVAAQTYPNVELLVVNDGGADVSDVIAPFRDRLSIVYLTPGAVGRCKAGNLALEASHGDWIAWLDDDDLYYPDHLASLVAFAKETSSKVVYSQANVIHQTFNPATGGYVDGAPEPAPSFEFSKLSLWRGNNIHLVTALYARAVHDQLGGFDEALSVLEDVDLFARFAQDFAFKRCPKITAAYRIRDDKTNAVTALRKEFVTTRPYLMARHSHIVLSELIGIVEHGLVAHAEMTARIEALEAEVRRLSAKDRR
jgi:glycosyltransferase involved in cell wall biosynthesis